LAAAQCTGTEIRKYINDLQSHNKPRSPGISTKCLATPAGESYLAPKGHFFKESSRIAINHGKICNISISEDTKKLIVNDSINYFQNWIVKTLLTEKCFCLDKKIIVTNLKNYSNNKRMKNMKQNFFHYILVIEKNYTKS
jgi:hypothetical protein